MIYPQSKVRGRLLSPSFQAHHLPSSSSIVLSCLQMWSKIVALHGINGVDSTVLKDRNVFVASLFLFLPRRALELGLTILVRSVFAVLLDKAARIELETSRSRFSRLGRSLRSISAGSRFVRSFLLSSCPSFSFSSSDSLLLPLFFHS